MKSDKASQITDVVMSAKMEQLNLMIADIDMFTLITGILFAPGLRAEIVELKEEMWEEDI